MLVCNRCKACAMFILGMVYQHAISNSEKRDVYMSIYTITISANRNDLK